MRYVSRVPRGPLADLVDYVWALSDAPSHSRERILPTGTLELVVNLTDDEFHILDPSGATAYTLSGAILAGARRRFFLIDTREQASVVGVRFKAGGAFPLLPVSPGEIGDAHVELGGVWGRRARVLRDELCAAGSVTERLSILERELERRLSERAQRHPAVQTALRLLRGAATSVGRVAARAGLSNRRLTEIFHTEVGMTPKLFHRVRRFQEAVALARRSPSDDWGRIAQRAGYFDQSHLIRDVEEFAGISPVELSRSAVIPVKDNHLAIPPLAAPIAFHEPRHRNG